MFNKIKNKIKYFVAPLIVIGVILVCPFSVLAIDDKGYSVAEPTEFNLDYGELPRMKMRSSTLATYSTDTSANYILNVDNINDICRVVPPTKVAIDNFFIDDTFRSCTEEFINIKGLSGSKVDSVLYAYQGDTFTPLGAFFHSTFNPYLLRFRAPWIKSSGTADNYYFYIYFFFNLQNVSSTEDYVVDFTITAYDQPIDVLNVTGVSIMYDSDGVPYSDFVANKIDDEHIAQLHFNPVDCYLPSDKTLRRHFNFVVSGDVLKNAIRLGFCFTVSSQYDYCYFGLSKGTSFTVRKYDPTTDAINNATNSILNAGDGYSNPNFGGGSATLNNIDNNINDVGNQVEVDIPDMNTRYHLATQLLEIDGMGSAFENINMWLEDFVDSNLIIYMLITLSLVIALFVHIIGRGFN